MFGIKNANIPFNPRCATTRKTKGFLRRKLVFAIIGIDKETENPMPATRAVFKTISLQLLTTRYFVKIEDLPGIQCILVLGRMTFLCRVVCSYFQEMVSAV